MPYTFRPAVESDVQAIADIYNASVMAGGATADLTPRTFDQRRAWVESHTPPYGVFVVESEDGSIIGAGADGALTHFDEPANAVLLVHHVIAFFELHQVDGLAPAFRRFGHGHG